MMRSRFLKEACTAIIVALMALPANAGSPAVTVIFDNGSGVPGPNPGQVNGAGATLFVPFFLTPQSTYDDCPDTDGDGCCGLQSPVVPPCTTPLDQLAESYTPGQPSLTTYWAFQYRSVGSVNGFREFVDSQLCDILWGEVPGERGLLNRGSWAVGGVKDATIAPGQDCLTPTGPPYLPPPPLRGFPPGDGTADNDSGTPLCIDEIHFGLLDVPSIWGVAVPSIGPDLRADARWFRSPEAPGYGFNPILAWEGWDSRLNSLGRDPVTCDRSEAPGRLELNYNYNNPDDNTLYDTTVAYAIVSYNINQGVGGRDYRMTDMQHLFTTGRRKTGENLAAITRSSGSGTRNAISNTSGIDPSWMSGDNTDNEWPVTANSNLGPRSRFNNGESSSNVEQALQSRRLGLGYTGLFGAGRAIDDANAGHYEICNIMFDDRGGTQFVRPNIRAVVENCDPNVSYQIGGEVSFVTRGDPLETNPAVPQYIEYRPVAEYLKNIIDSIRTYTDPGSIPVSDFMPGQYLVRNFTLTAGCRCLPNRTDPTNYVPNPDFNATIQQTIIDTTFAIVPPFGSVNPYGRVPRRATSGASEDPLLAGQTWLDGTPASANTYRYKGTGGAFFTIQRDRRLGSRNAIQGDLNGDGLRNINDIPKLMEAAKALADDTSPTGDGLLNWAFTQGAPAGDAGEQTGGNYLLIHIMGDFDGDGNFNGNRLRADTKGTTDVRFFADGLAINPARPIALYGPALDRKAGFTAVDTQWALLTGGADNNYFNTVVSNGAYEPGDSRFDVSGNLEAPGADPRGADGIVDVKDVDYVARNVHFGGATPAARNWLNTDVAALPWTGRGGRVTTLDLSADMTGPTDCNSDGNWELLIDAADIAEIERKGCTAASQGDSNNDGVADFNDINCFVSALIGYDAWLACVGPAAGVYSFGVYYCGNDANRDGRVDFNDIAAFVSCLTGSCPPAGPVNPCN